MSTSLFTGDGSQGFVAVKTLKQDEQATGVLNPPAASASTAHPGAVVANSNYSSYSTAKALLSASPRASASTPLPLTTSLMSDLEKAFVAEIEVMKQLRHPNLVLLLGVCMQATPYMMVLEYLPGGSLDAWISRNGPMLLTPKDSNPAKLVHMLHQIALGMVELGKVGIVHRDLAARNILVDKSLNVKIADYGLSRDVEEDRNYYRIKTERAIPLRWTAPEAVTHLRQSVASDVYSFGVVVFEVFSFAAFPFAEFWDDLKFIAFLTATAGAAEDASKPPACQPLLDQANAVLQKHGVRGGLPKVAEKLMRGCVVRKVEERLSFSAIARATRPHGVAAHRSSSSSSSRKSGSRADDDASVDTAAVSSNGKNAPAHLEQSLHETAVAIPDVQLLPQQEETVVAIPTEQQQYACVDESAL